MIIDSVYNLYELETEVRQLAEQRVLAIHNYYLSHAAEVLGTSRPFLHKLFI